MRDQLAFVSTWSAIGCAHNRAKLRFHLAHPPHPLDIYGKLKRKGSTHSLVRFV
jgi:hypothetical protein